MSLRVSVPSGHRRHDDDAPPQATYATSTRTSGGLLRARFGSSVALPRCSPASHRSRLRRIARSRRHTIDQASYAAQSRHYRSPFAIAAAPNGHRGTRRGFLPRGLCDTCPQASPLRDHLRQADVAQALTECVIRPSDRTPVGTNDGEGVFRKHHRLHLCGVGSRRSAGLDN